MLKPLLRIIPSYSGNVKINCQISDYVYDKRYTNAKNESIDVYECRVRNAFIDTASTSLSRKKVKCSLLGGSYDYDLRTFFTYNKDTFYNSGFDFLRTDIEKIDRTINQYQRNIDLEYGCKRISLKENGYQYEFFAPIYIDDISSLPDSFTISLSFSTGTYNIIKELKVVLNDVSSNSRYNYLYTYLKKYLSKVDNKVGTLMDSNNSLILYGIDLNKGGMCMTVDSGVSDLFSKQQTINNFDATIATAYKRCNMAMKQVIPLSFQFNIDDVLTYKEKSLLLKSPIQVSGYYELNGHDIPLYDFSNDYDKYVEDVYKMDEKTGVLTWISGSVPNIMGDKFPSLNECTIRDYQYSNKLSKMYTRWKLLQSDDNHPYIVNTSFAFNRNQDSQILYGLYPKETSPIQSLAIEQKDDRYNYSLIVPIDENKKYYTGQYSEIPNLYRKSVESYQFNWFDIIDSNSSDWKSNIYWGDVINNKCYYNGIIHDLSLITNKSTENINIDKFAVVLNPILNDVVDSVTSKDLCMPIHTILTDSSEYYKRNAFTNSRVILKMLGIENKNSNWLYSNENDSNVNSELVVGNIYKKSQPSTYSTAYIYDKNDLCTYAYLSDPYARYLDPNEIGLDLDDINKYYDGSALLSYMDVVRKELRYSNILDWCKKEDVKVSYTDIVTETANILKSNIDNLLLLGASGNELITSTYLIQGNELIDFHVPGILCDDNGHVIMSGNHSYISNTYIMKRNTFTFLPDNTIDYSTYTSEYALIGDPATTMVITCSYDEVPNWEERYPSIKGNWIGYTDATNKIMFSLTYEILTSKPFLDPIYNLISASTISKLSPAPCGIVNMLDPSLSYIMIPNYPTSSYLSYNASIYNSSCYFVKNTSIEDMAYRNIEADMITYINTSKIYDIKKVGNKESKEWQMVHTARVMHDKVTSMILSYIETKDKFSFLPVAFNNTNPFAYKVFVKKDSKMSSSNIININNVTKVDDVLWIDVYNMNAVLEEYKQRTGIECKTLMRYPKRFKAKFLSKEHLYWWYTELVADENRKRPVNFAEKWSSRVYIKTKNIVLEENRLKVKDCYKSIKNTEYPKSFKEFFELLKYDPIKNIWKIGENGDPIELVFDCNFVRVNSKIYGPGKLIDLSDSKQHTYKDLYIYRIERESDWEGSFIQGMKSRYINPNIDDVSDIEISETNSCLIPLFNEIYQQEKNDTSIYAIYKLEGLQEVRVLDNEGKYIDSLQRYSQYNSNCLIELTDETLKVLSEPIERNGKWFKSRFETITGKILNNCLWSNLAKNVIGLDKEEDELNLGLENFNTFTKNGNNYGYYKINYKVDNTLSSMELSARTLVSSKDDPNERYIDNIVKYVKYINGVNIDTNKPYFIKILKELMPMMKKNPCSILSAISTITNPTTLQFTNRYSTSLCENYIDKQFQPTETNISFNNVSGYKYKLTRYFGDIVPVIQKRNSLSNIWNLKYKNVDTNLLNTGKYNSIGDTPIYATNISITEYEPHYIYTISDNEKVKNYNYKANKKEGKFIKYDTYTPLEYKHFNNSRMLLLPSLLTYILPYYIDYDKLKEEEDNEHTLNVFRKLINMKSISDDDYLFLYKYYTVSYDSIPVKLNAVKDAKLWKLKYIFELK